MPAAFHLIALPVASEAATLQAALDALTEVEPGEAVFYSETLAWSADGAGVAYARMVRAAREREVNLFATLSLGGELLEDLPGRGPGARHHAMVVFTRHGDVHVPQAKCLPDAVELAGAPAAETPPVLPYGRTNLVRLDMEEQLIEVRFLIGADIALLADHPPAALSCDVLVSLARLPHGADTQVRATLADARATGLCATTVQVNGIFARGDRPVCVKVEEAVDHGRVIAARPRWPTPARLERRLYRYGGRRRDADGATAIDRLDRDPKRAGRIPTCRPPRAAKIVLGRYPITIVL